MASSSKTHENEEREGDWLELGLGFGSSVNRSSSASSSSSSSLPSHRTHRHCQFLGLGLGFGLGFDGNDGLYQHHDGHDDDHDDMAPSSYTCFKTPSLSSWPLLLDSDGGPLHNRLLPVCRPMSPGLWFTLRSSINRKGEELPQVPKAYIRVKDENVTVLMVKTYLVRKLGLSNEAEVDISCMGQKLSQSQTLKHVRDDIWLPRLVESVHATTSGLIEYSHDTLVDHLMSLHYGRRSFFI